MLRKLQASILSEIGQIESDTIVADRDIEPATVALQMHLCRMGTAVSFKIAKAFLDNAKQTQSVFGTN